jgi:glycosyltransferase involved in cell wall biosynthesis
MNAPVASDAVACIIAAWNAERHLGAAIRSVLAQTRPVAEIVVVDDGSNDATAEVAASFGAPVRVLRQANGGQASALNRGIAESRAPILALLDSDDLWEPHKLEVQVPVLVAGADYAVTLIRNFVSEEVADRTVRDPRLLDPVAGYVASTLALQRRLLGRIGVFDTTLKHANVTAWFLRAREAGAAGEVVREVLVHRRLHERNFSARDGEVSRREHVDLVKGVLDRRRAAAREAKES